MRQGYHPKLVFTSIGNLVAISTGSDACAEHECGSEPLQRALSNAFASDDHLVSALKAGLPVTEYPSLVARKRITKFPPGLQFIDIPAKPGGEPQAILGYCDGPPLHFFMNELRFTPKAKSDTVSDFDENIGGAWCEDAFAIRVRGKKYVQALRDFNDALRAGHVLFAGTFFKRDRSLGGVILADERYLDDDARVAMNVAQADYESKLRLRARDDSHQLLQEMRQAAGQAPRPWTGEPGHIWAIWKDAQESEVIYGLNPSNRMKADYFGPYTRQELLDWASSKYESRLSPRKARETRATAAAA